MPRHYSEHYTYEYTKTVSPSGQQMLTNIDKNFNDETTRKEDFYQQKEQSSAYDLNNNLIFDEYNPYSYGFRPLSESNIYRTFEIIRPTDLDHENIDNHSTTNIQQNVDDNQTRMITKDQKPQTTKTLNYENEENYDEVDNQMTKDSYAIPIHVQTINERAIDVPEEYHNKLQQTSLKKERDSDSSSSPPGRIINVTLTGLNDPDGKQFLYDTVSTKPPLPPSTKNEQRQHYRTSSKHHQQRSSSAHHHKHHRSNRDDHGRFRSFDDKGSMFHIPMYREWRSLSPCCPTRDELHQEPVPTLLHSYKCTKYELEETTTTTKTTKH